MMTSLQLDRRASSAVRTCVLLAMAILCEFIAVTASQNAAAAAQQSPAPITDPTIIISQQSTNVSAPQEKPAAGSEAEEGQEGTESTDGPEGAESQGEGAEGQEEAEGTEQEEEAEGAEGGQEALEDQIEDLVEQYRNQGLTASLEALQTMYPGVNMTDLLMEDLAEMEEGGGEMEKGEKELEGSEGSPYTSGQPTSPLPSQPLASDAYGDYQVDLMGQPVASYAFVPSGGGSGPRVAVAGAPPRQGINPTRVQNLGATNTEGGKARLFDVGANNAGPFNPNQVVRHPVGMTASATFGIVVGTIILSWLIVGPALCLAWRWNEKRREKKKILLQRPHTHGSVDEGIMDAMVMSELGKISQHKTQKTKGKGSSSALRRQTDEDVQQALIRNRSELAFSLPSTSSTRESRVI